MIGLQRLSHHQERIPVHRLLNFEWRKDWKTANRRAGNLVDFFDSPSRCDTGRRRLTPPSYLILPDFDNRLETLELAAQGLLIGRLERPAKPLGEDHIAADEEQVSRLQHTMSDAQAVQATQGLPVPPRERLQCAREGSP
ncbi:hypothetical protein F5Y12DRAFT_718204 [Xylaria sp. FL1777]|nr:hypothetical protein F5Y12DRAFT_718204 [Xylaria sp. FL1777]